MTNQSRAARIEAAARAFLTAFEGFPARYDEVMAADDLRRALALPADPQPAMPHCPKEGHCEGSAAAVGCLEREVEEMKNAHDEVVQRMQKAHRRYRDWVGKRIAALELELRSETMSEQEIDKVVQFVREKTDGTKDAMTPVSADPQPVAMAEVMGKVLSYIRESVMEFVGTNRDGVTYWRADPDRVIASFNGAIDRAAAKAAQHQETTMERPKIEGCACPPCSGEPPRTDTTRIQELLDRVGRSRDLVGESDMIDGDIWSMQCVLKEVWQALPACRNALDLLGVALTVHNHQWTAEQWTAYDTATEWLNKLWPEWKQ